MSVLESVSVAADDLAELVLRYQALRDAGDSFNAARTRKRMVDAAHAARACTEMARTKCAEAVESLSLTPWGRLRGMARAAPLLRPANDTTQPTMDPTIA